jgi:lipoprotein-anchoring transpeptidase ErfK/SrfK
VSSRIRKVALASITACAVLASGTALVRAAVDDSTTTIAPPDTSVEAPATLSVPAPVKPSRIKLPRRKVSIAYARIVLDEQQAYFYNNKRKLIAKLPVSTGLDGSTPTGRFKVFSRSAQTFYIPRPQEKMKFMTRFTVGRNGGNIGFHGIPYVETRKGNVRFPTPLGIAPSSHGCIRMLDSHAQWVFDNLPQEATVTVVKSRR